MIGLLVKKQFKELFGGLSKKSDGTARKKGSKVGYVILYIVLFIIYAGMFATFCLSVCGVFHEAGMDWAYFTLTFIAAAFIGLVGSIFTAYSALYNAKDNEFLLSMPLKPSQILFARMLTIYLFSLVFELVVAIPSLVIYMIRAEFSLKILLLGLFVYFCMSLIVFALIVALGYLVARVATHIRNKSIFVTIFSLVLFGGYYYVCFNLSDIMMNLIANAVLIGKKMESNLNPFYHMGRAVTGNFLSLLIVAAMAALLFGISYVLVSRSFIKIVTTNKGGVGKVYKETAQKAGSQTKALLKRELLHLSRSPMYMLNSCMADIFMLLIGAVLIIKSGDLLEVLSQVSGIGFDLGPYLAVGIAAIMSFMISMNIYTASSISIEGKKYIWLLKSTPVPEIQIFHAKLGAHIIITLPLALICTLIASVVLGVPAGKIVLLLVFITGITILFACFGLFLNLRHPKMDWTSEIVVVKQSASVMLTMFGGMFIVILLFAPFFIFLRHVTDWIYLLGVTVIVYAGAAALYGWLRTGGVKVFRKL